MKLSVKIIIILSLAGFSALAQQTAHVAVEPGVSLQLARYRKTAISNIQYNISLNVPASKAQPIDGFESLSFDLSKADENLQIDFKQDASHVKSVVVNEKTVVTTLDKEHIIISKEHLHVGRNKVDIQFIPGDASLNRNDDYLYALFVPDRARTVFPCFDQPDLKAHFSLNMTVPSTWHVLANASMETQVKKGTQIAYQFKNSDLLSTYLFSFTAGKYTSVKKTIGSREAELLYRETDSSKIRLSVDSIFKAHHDAISFMEEWTGIPFPFQKVGFVAIPDFQFGGMEHPGEVQYRASGLFLDGGATKDQFIARSNVISHETAHMWFGDMVTMEWFNDVWMKEVFANFMADKVTEKLMGSETFNQKFLQDHYPAAYNVDRTLGANAIRQDLDNLQDAGSMYGNIIYHKAPVMMRQLEHLMGKDQFRAGIQEYLKKYAYNNATWNDLIAILSKYSKQDLYAWNKVWVNEPGRPVFDYDITYSRNKIDKFIISQHPEYGTPRVWPQAFTITLVYSGSEKTIPVDMTQQTVELNLAAGMAKPSYIIFNSDGTGYGVFPADKQINGELFKIISPLQRASVYIAAYENMLAGRYFKPAELLDLLQSGHAAETDEMNLRLLTSYLNGIYWTFLSADARQSHSVALEKALWSAMQQQATPNNKKLLFKAYQDIYLSTSAQKDLYYIWKRQQAPTGVRLTEDDYTSLAFSLALRSDTATTILKKQENRIMNADRKKRIEFSIPALSSDVRERDAFFASLANRSNRQKEAWVVSALAYLHHPLRQNTSARYLPQSLELVVEIQKTGDIFFPQSWLGAIFGSYQSKQAAQIVQDFLQSHPDYNPKLKNKILQAADNVYRAQKLVNDK